MDRSVERPSLSWKQNPCFHVLFETARQFARSITRTHIKIGANGTQNGAASVLGNDQPYQSIGRWLLDQNLTKDATWPGIKAWLAQNPKRTQDLLAKNPRFVFFKEEALTAQDALLGPKGAQGVPLTAGRSIAVDRGSIPYGTPVWLRSQGPVTSLDKLVLAQDTGTAIVGAVRADYYAGSGTAAGELAGRMKQPLQLWVLWPK